MLACYTVTEEPNLRCRNGCAMCSPLQQSQQNGPPQAPFGPQTGKEEALCLRLNMFAWWRWRSHCYLIFCCFQKLSLNLQIHALWLIFYSHYKIKKMTISSSENWDYGLSLSFPVWAALSPSESSIPKPSLPQIEQISPLGFQVVNNYPVRKSWCSIFSAASFFVAVPSNWISQNCLCFWSLLVLAASFFSLVNF